MNIATCTCTHKEHNKNKVHCVVQVTCHVGRSGHLESGSELRCCDLRRVVFEFDHYLGVVVKSSIGHSSWSGREERDRDTDAHSTSQLRCLC